MPNTSLSPELCSRIVQFVDVRHTSDLARLCTVSKVFLKEAEPRLYSQLVFGDPRRAVGALRSVGGAGGGGGGGGAVARLPKGLRGLSILDLPEEYAVEVLEAVSVSCPELRALGQFPLPILKRHKFTASLMRLHYLRCIEVDLSSWQPMPVAGAQRALAAELKTFCPSLRWVVVWLQHTRVTWTYGQNEMWVYRVEGNQWRGGGKLWLKT